LNVTALGIREVREQEGKPDLTGKDIPFKTFWQRNLLQECFAIIHIKIMLCSQLRCQKVLN